MGWMGNWLGNWMGSWFGLGQQQQQQPDAAPYTRYGRVLKRARDKLFADSDARCEISPGAVILSRTATDDYVRMRIPDTYCPPLPQPNSPMDSGVADEAEPNRWQYGGQYVPGSGWLISGAPGSAIDWVRPSYGCYEGNFLTRVTVRPTGSFQYPIYYITDYFGLFVVLDNSIGGVGFGGAVRPSEGTFAVNMLLWHSVTGGRAYNVWVDLNTPVHLFIRRAGGTISVGWSVTNPNAPDANTEIEIAYGVLGPVQLRLAKDFYLPETQPPQPPTSRISAVVTEWRTISGAPSSISVTTPVLDVGQPWRVVVQGLPSAAQLVWRASNDLPLPDYWDNPVGEYRYWQARLQTSSSNVLLERIEFLPDAFPLLLWRRFRSYWQLFETGEGRLTKGPFRTVFGSGNQRRTQDGWIQQSDEERNIGDGWL